MENVVINGVLTSYREYGQQHSDTITILPGWGQTGQHWREVASQLASNYRVITLDLPGFGGTAFLTNEANIPEYAHFVEAFLEKMGITDTIILGHSFGGQIATYLSINSGKLISKMILISPAVIRRDLISHKKILLKLLRPFRFIARLFPKLAAKIQSEDYQSSSLRQQEIFKKIIRYDLSEKLKTIKALVIVIWGNQDRVIPYDGKRLVEIIPRAQLRVLYGAGHHPHLTHGKELSEIVLEAIEC